MADSILAWELPNNRRELEDANGVLIRKLFMPVGHLMPDPEMEWETVEMKQTLGSKTGTCRPGASVVEPG